MNNTCRKYLGLALFGLSVTAMAQPRWQVDPAQLPPGLSPEKAVAMLEETDRKTARELADEEAAQQRKAERVQRAARKYEERLARAVEKDPELRALQEKLEAGMKALANPELSEEQRRERLERMAPDMKALRSKGVAKAGIDERAMNGEIRRALSGDVTPRGETAGEEAGMLQEEGGAFYYKPAADEGLPPASKVTTRGTTTYMLTEPWPYAESRTVVGSSSGSANKADGTYYVKARATGVGYGTNRRGLAHFLTVPQGTTRIRVTTRLPETSFYNSAYGALLGGGQSRTYSMIEVWDGSSQRLCRSYKKHADVWALVAAYFRQYGDDNVLLDCEFDAPAAGRDILIKFTSAAFVQAWGSGYGFGNVSAKPADVRVDLISPDPTYSAPQRIYSVPR